ncbi:hypothetical protein QVD17_10435 [Tagetes erecta]|uniref:Reverse transcriptase zinc-binding domain-containing protein n=1 Tax=Tagetes erecta TaxID=13708 RepID=A0AAD8L3B3_TARER|nr:hypothetical protein QVD17_10435 [Tagetes erecta]
MRYKWCLLLRSAHLVDPFRHDHSVNWIWRWKRPLTDEESQQLQSCLSILTTMHLNDRAGRWKWTKDDSGVFSVASMRKLSGASQTQPNFILKWNNWVPIKVNVFGWRA